MRWLTEGQINLNLDQPLELLRRIYWLSYLAKDETHPVSKMVLVLDRHSPKVLSLEALTSPSPVTTFMHTNNKAARYINSLGSTHQERLQTVGKQLVFEERVELQVNSYSRYTAGHQPLVSQLLAWIPSATKVDVRWSLRYQRQTSADWTVLSTALANLSVVTLESSGNELPLAIFAALMQPTLESIVFEGMSTIPAVPPGPVIKTLSGLRSLHASSCSVDLVMAILQHAAAPIRKIELGNRWAPYTETKALVIPAYSVDEDTDLTLCYSGPIQAPAHAQLKQLYSPTHLEHRLQVNTFRMLDIVVGSDFNEDIWTCLSQATAPVLGLHATFPAPLPQQPREDVKALYWEETVGSIYQGIARLEALPATTSLLSKLFPNASFVLLRYSHVASREFGTCPPIPIIIVPNPLNPITLQDYGRVALLLCSPSIGRRNYPKHLSTMLAVVLAGEHLGWHLPTAVLTAIFIAYLQRVFSSAKQAQELTAKWQTEREVNRFRRYY